MAIGRDARRAERAPSVESVLGKPAASAGLDLLELLEYAWHDCVALHDRRDLRLWAEDVSSDVTRAAHPPSD